MYLPRHLNMAPAQSDTWSSLKLFGLVKPSPIMFNLVHRLKLFMTCCATTQSAILCSTLDSVGTFHAVFAQLVQQTSQLLPSGGLWVDPSELWITLLTWIQDLNPSWIWLLWPFCFSIAQQVRGDPHRWRAIWASAKAPTSLVYLVVDVENRWYIPGIYGTDFSWGSWWSNTGTLSNLSTKVTSRGCDVKFVKVQETWNKILCASFEQAITVVTGKGKTWHAKNWNTLTASDASDCCERWILATRLGRQNRPWGSPLNPEQDPSQRQASRTRCRWSRQGKLPPSSCQVYPIRNQEVHGSWW